MDTSNEDCPVYKWNVCRGRLANLATQKKDEAKMKIAEVVLSGIGERIVILKARRDFVPSSNCVLTMVTRSLKRCLTTAVKHNFFSISLFMLQNVI